LSDRKHKPIAYLALGLSVLAIGVSPIFIRMAQAPGTISMFYRMMIGAVLMTVPFLRTLKVKKAKEEGISRKAVFYALLGGLFFTLDLVFYSTGVMLSGAAKSTLLSNTAPIWVGLGAMVF
jgi:drug/metabolite transporter (DMT)-like permease